MIDVEVRSSGPGPRAPIRNTRAPSSSGVWADSLSMAARWTRSALDYKGRKKRLCDGVAIIIRMST